MKSLKTIALTVFITTVFSICEGQSREDFSFGFIIGPGSTRTSVVDNLPDPSRRSRIADGQTSVDENNLHGRTIRLIANYNMSESVALSSGLWFGNRGMNIRNDDGSYIGTSVYRAYYLHLPLLLRYRSNEIADYMRVIVSFGPTFDIRTGEENFGADYAHFMNFAQNRFDIDPQRGRNGNNIPMNLFNSTGLSVYLGAGLEYSFSDSFSAFAGLSYHHGLTNILNSKLLFNDAERTPITETISWKTSLLAFDFGVGFSF